MFRLLRGLVEHAEGREEPNQLFPATQTPGALWSRAIRRIWSRNRRVEMESAEGGGPRPALASQADAGAGVARDLAAVEERSPGGSGSSSAEEEEEDATAPLQRVPSFDLEAGVNRVWDSSCYAGMYISHKQRRIAVSASPSATALCAVAA